VTSIATAVSSNEVAALHGRWLLVFAKLSKEPIFLADQTSRLRKRHRGCPYYPRGGY
jgi:hypothetical protein